MDPVETHKHIKRLHAYIFILTVSVLSLVWFLFKDQLKVIKKEQLEVPLAKLKGENKGEISLVMKNNLRKVPVNVPFTVQVVADSQSEDIVGFDVLLAHDQEAFKVVSATSPLKGYVVVNTSQKGHLAVTGTQSPQDATRNVFEDQVILEVTFNPTTVGEYEFSVLPKSGNATSKLVSTNTEIFFPQVESLTVNVE